MSDGFPRVREALPGTSIPSQPTGPNVASERAAALAQQQRAEQQIFDRQAADRGAVFSAVQSMLGTAGGAISALGESVQRALSFGAAARREKAQTRFVFESQKMLNNIAAAEDPEQAFADWWENTEQLQYETQSGIRNPEQEARFTGWAENWKRQQLAGATQTMEGRTVELARQGIIDNLNAAIDTGDPEMVFGIVSAGRGDGFLSPAEADRMMNSGVNAAAKSQITKAAQVIYDQHGLTAALQWIRDPDNHDARYRLTGGDLHNVAIALQRQAQADEAGALAATNTEKEAFLNWIGEQEQEGETVTYAAVEAKALDLMPSLTPYERVERARAGYRFATESPYHDIAKGIADEQEAKRKSIVYARLDQIVNAATPAQFGHVQRVLLDNLGRGDIRQQDYSNWMTVLRRQVPDSAEAGLQYIRNAFSHITDWNAASEQFPGVPEKRFETVGAALFVKGDEFKREEDQGDLLAVTDARGNSLYRSLAGISRRLEGELVSIIRRGIDQGESIDPITLARQLVNRELVGLSEGTTLDVLTGDETPYPFQVREEAAKFGIAQQHERFPDVEAVARGIKYVGPEGMGREALTSLAAPIDSLWTGYDALELMQAPDYWGRFAEHIPANEAWNASRAEWRSYVDAGQYELAAYVAADMLPRSADALGELYADGDIYGFREEADGTFMVKFTELGREYPVLPLGDAPRASSLAPALPAPADTESTTTAPLPSAGREIGQMEARILEEEITGLIEEWDGLGEQMTETLNSMNSATLDVHKHHLQGIYDDLNSRRQWIGRRITEKKKSLQQ